MARIGLLFFLLVFFLHNSALAQEIKSLADPAAIHQLFKVCKKGKTLYTCNLPGKTINATLNKTHNAFVTPTLEDNAHYDVYWWPDGCTPPANLKISNRCVFHLLLQKEIPPTKRD